MDKQEEKKTNIKADRKPIESFMTDPAVHEAVCIREHWAKGKEVSKEDYEKAVKGFLGATCGSYKEKK